MTSNRLTTVSAGAFALSLITAPVAAQTAYSDWDANSDLGVDRQEWNTGWGQNGVFDRFDADGDGRITESEWNEGRGMNQTGSVTGGNEGPTFDQRFGENAWSAWDSDGDGALSEKEFGDGVFAGYDRDASGAIEEPEFGDYGDDIGDGGFWDV